MISLKKILVPVDFSNVSKLALTYAASFCAEYGAELHLLHVIEEETLHPGQLDDRLNVNAKWEKESMTRLGEFLGPSLAQLDAKKTVRGGLVYEGIIEYAKENAVDLIVMGSHGNSGFMDSWLGGTAYEVTRKSVCPVLTVKPSEKPFVTDTPK